MTDPNQAAPSPTPVIPADPAPTTVPASNVPATQPEGRYFRRFTLGQRYLHAVLFSTFLGLAATGLPLRFSSTPWAIRLAKIVDGFGTILFFHKFCALLLTLAFIIHVREIVARGIFKRDKSIFWGPTSMVANWKDVKDLYGHMRWFLGLGPKPRFERYAYWEKFDYWAVFWGMVVIGFSGYAMWFAPFFARFLPGWALNAALVIHSEEGLLAILFIFSIHFVNTHLRPDSFPMDMVIFTGRESEEEFKNRRPEEYKRMIAEGKSATRIADAPPLWLLNFSRVVGFTAIVIGLTLLVLTLTAYIAG
jgi:cytochrome b subunit of formate dehydrogenase